MLHVCGYLKFFIIYLYKFYAVNSFYYFYGLIKNTYMYVFAESIPYLHRMKALHACKLLGRC